jgi:hypothetical protein
MDKKECVDALNFLTVLSEESGILTLDEIPRLTKANDVLTKLIVEYFNHNII